MRKDDLHIANLSFLLDYDEGLTNDEIEYEIFKVAFQEEETIHYDRQTGGNFRHLEQEPTNLAIGLKFTTGLVTSIYLVNQEKSNQPYIVLGAEDITIEEERGSDNFKYNVYVEYMLYQDMDTNGALQLS
ncbi:MAG: hypothetical protein GY853_01905 [PVC group bacterium]|nr:hypothetical protein [PVC group bacterium]